MTNDEWGASEAGVVREDAAFDLRARTMQFARRFVRLYAKLPKATLPQVIGKQILRSGTSVGANYREADRARSPAEFVAKMGDCLKELDETGYWLELMIAEGLFKPPLLEPLLDETQQLIAIFHTIIHRAKTPRS